MDQQDPRVTAERLSGRGSDDAIGFETAAGKGRGTAAARGRTLDRTAAPRAIDDDDDPTALEPAADQRTRAIQADIEQTREELSETVSAIQERLRPSAVAANAVESIRTAATDAAGEVADSQPMRYVTANPLPSAMVGVGVLGLAWLALRGRDGGTSNPSRVYDRSRYAPTAGRQQTSYQGSAASGYTPSLSSSQQVYGNSSSRAHQVTSAAQNHLARTWSETPLLVGAAALVAGAIVGLSIPESERERQLMGETRDRLLDTAQRTVQDKVTQVQEAAVDAVGRVQEVAKEVTGLAGDRT